MIDNERFQQWNKLTELKLAKNKKLKQAGLFKVEPSGNH